MDITKVDIKQKGCLLAIVTVLLPCGLSLELVLMTGVNGPFLKYPSREYEVDGKKKSWALARWVDRDLGDRFNNQVIEKLKDSHRTLFTSNSIRSAPPEDFNDHNLPF